MNQQWNKRSLTPVGKVTVVKSLILPLLNQLFISLPNPNDDLIKTIENMLLKFIWKSPLSKVKKRRWYKKNIKKGG